MKLLINPKSDQRADALFRANVGPAFFGDLGLDGIAIIQTGEGENSEIQVARSDLSNDGKAYRSTVLIAFQFQAMPDVLALGRYVTDRDAALTRHGGIVVMSAVTPRSSGWAFDGFEIIDFPEPSTMQSLMNDEGYRSSTAISSAVFGGVFAAAPLSVF